MNLCRDILECADSEEVMATLNAYQLSVGDLVRIVNKVEGWTCYAVGALTTDLLDITEIEGDFEAGMRLRIRHAAYPGMFLQHQS